MDTERPHLSITLPRNFTFHYEEGNMPRTPEPEPVPEDFAPPPPPRQVLKVRRRRTTFVPTYDLNDVNDAPASNPIPTIEGPELHPEPSSDLPVLPPALDCELLSPSAIFGRMLSPPKTPVAQISSLSNTDGPHQWAEMDLADQSETSSRPTSSGGYSDSSVSSRDSLESFPSLGGSCASPPDDIADPFIFSPALASCSQLASPPAIHAPRAPAKLKLRATFTEEMDHHLWMTYLKYLQDPTVTPFKALPSTVPPNGVCHRVAREARKSWKGGRPSGLSKLSAVQPPPSRSSTPNTLRPDKSGSSTPLPFSNKPYARHPDEKQTRKRLRYLARQMPTLSAHYKRLLHRSPSPLQSSPPASSEAVTLPSPFAPSTSSFSTRDMNVSLAASTSSTMQAGNSLSQLMSGATPQPAPLDRANMRASAHQKSQSLHIGLGLGVGGLAGSSFRAMSEMTDASMNQHNNARTWHAPSARPPRLGSPLQLHAPRPMSRPFKRRALHDFEPYERARGNSFVDQLFGAPAESSHRRVRSRGFSLGDMMDGARRLPSNSGLPGSDPFVDAESTTPLPNPTVVQLQSQAPARLGSPFGGCSNHTFPRAAATYGFEHPASFEQRFAGLADGPHRLSQQ